MEKPNKKPPKSKNTIKNKSHGTPTNLTILKLWVRAGGRCEFDGCGKYLLTDDLTQQDVNRGNVAHIVAKSPDGPRGQSTLTQEQRHEVANLMLLCLDHHTPLIDAVPATYPVPLLRRYKREHEERIIAQTEATPERTTSIIRMRANIGDEVVQISNAQIRAAIAPNFPKKDGEIEIDFTKIFPNESSYTPSQAAKVITEQIEKFYAPGITKGEINRISVFALGPIPLLAHLGYLLSNKIPVDLFQRHRDTQDWVWKKSGKNVKYRIRKIRKGSNPSEAVLSLALCGKNDLEAIQIPDNAAVYEITLEGQKPNVHFLKKHQDLELFRFYYQKFLCDLRNSFPNLKKLHLYPAIPAPIAVVCGMDLLKKRDPAIVVYDFKKDKGGFIKSLTIN